MTVFYRADRKKWRVWIIRDGKQISLGHFSNKSEAESVYENYVRENPRATFFSASSREEAESADAILAERFFPKVGRKQPNGCIPWAGSLHWDQYGVMRVGGFSMTAHRVSYMLCVGKIPPGFSVLHQCDNPPCVNPSHLFLGTALDNALDMVAKRRHAFGEKNSGAKLSESDVLEIRRRFVLDHDIVALAKDFGISLSQINKIVNRKKWTHI